ncbi:MAG: galactose-1-phosphate uridylyltransferase [Thermoguttaceae bacterium]
MSDLRKDPILDHWVIVAANRSQRPGAFIESPPFEPGLPCPFCEGHENETPREVLAFRHSTSKPDAPQWRVRVVPNKFPAIETCSETRSLDEGIYQRLDACGGHEVIIESPRHVVSTSDLETAELTEVFLAYQMRLADWKRDPRMAYGQVFKNVGQAAGASLEHTHSQLLVIPRVPSVIAAEMTAALNYFRQRGCCPFCDMVREELAVGQRMIEETVHHLAFAPFAARLPFETWILPKCHAGHYEESPRGQLEDLASIVRSVIRRLEAAVGRCAYNYVLHTAPFDITAPAHYHWHIEVVPILARTAGFELGAGWYINLVAPEEAACRMREAE